MFHADKVPDAIGYYFAGFVDGEGSFHLTFRRRRDYKMPWKVSLCLNVSQKDEVILALLKRHLQCGTIRFKGDGVWMYEVNNLDAIRAKRHSLLSAVRIPVREEETRFRDLPTDGRTDARKSPSQPRRDRRAASAAANMNDGGKRKYSDGEILAVFDSTESSETNTPNSEQSEMI